METTHMYAVEDWLVHAHYGIGQIKDVEEKCISGAEVQYFKIQTSDSTYWVPVDQIDSDTMRPIATREEFELAINVLRCPPEEMSSDHIVRKNRMRGVLRENSPQEIACLIRDMQARKNAKGSYSLDETNVLRTLRQRLIEEWGLVMAQKTAGIETTLDSLLEQGETANEN